MALSPTPLAHGPQAGQISPNKNMNCQCATAAFTLSPVPGGLCHLVLTRPETGPSMRFLSVGSHLCARASFRPPLTRLPLPSASSCICPTIGHYRYSYRGPSPHKFMPMSGVHQYVPTPQLSDTKLEAAIREVHPISATWFNAVQRRIQKSVAPLGQTIDDDGRWLSQDIADAASRFFKATSDVLPSEPFIYSSRKGDLVAEYLVAHGTMTNIVTQTSVIVFAVVDARLVAAQPTHCGKSCSE